MLVFRGLRRDRCFMLAQLKSIVLLAAMRPSRSFASYEITCGGFSAAWSRLCKALIEMHLLEPVKKEGIRRYRVTDELIDWARKCSLDCSTCKLECAIRGLMASIACKTRSDELMEMRLQAYLQLPRYLRVVVKKIELLRRQRKIKAPAKLSINDLQRKIEKWGNPMAYNQLLAILGIQFINRNELLVLDSVKRLPDELVLSD